MSKTVLNKAARRPPRVIVTRVVVLYKCREKGAEHQKWIEIPHTLEEGDKFTMHVDFNTFDQVDG